MTFIYETVNESTFIDGLRDHAKFSWYCAKALYDYYMHLAEDSGQPIEFNPIAIRCEWSEYESLEEAAKDIGCDPAYLKSFCATMQA